MTSRLKVGDIVERTHGGLIGTRARVNHIDADGDAYVSYPGMSSTSSPYGRCWVRTNFRKVEDIVEAAPETPKLQWTAIVGEKSRTYIFPDAQNIVVRDVVRLCARPSGHRLVTACGRKYIVPGKFLAIEIDAETWSA